MEKIKADVVVIGGGSGGLSFAAGAAQMGAKVILLEGHKMGGDCLNFGCVPSKALLAAGKAAHAMQTGKPFGISPAKPKVDYSAAKDHVDQVIAAIEPHDSQERFEGLGVFVIREYGAFMDKKTIQAGKYQIHARRIVIATGSGPFVPPIPGIDKVTYYTNENIFDLREKPKHLLVIGGGPIGMEMAQAHRRLGCDVTVIEGAKALGKDDPELAAMALEALRGEGITIAENALAQQITEDGGNITMKTSQGAFTGTHLLMAVGRKVNIDKLNLDAGGVDHDKAGIKVDAYLRSHSNRKVYAIGDVAGGFQFTHVAGYHAGVVIQSVLFGKPTKARTNHIPWATYTDPEIAQVGLSEDQARAQYGASLQVVRAEFNASDRAIAEGKTKGLVKVMVVKGRPVGASIVGPQAGELISMWAMAISGGLKMRAISDTILPYPTLMEVNKRAASAYFSPLLFKSKPIKYIVRFVQKVLP